MAPGLRSFPFFTDEKMTALTSIVAVVIRRELKAMKRVFVNVPSCDAFVESSAAL